MSEQNELPLLPPAAHLKPTAEEAQARIATLEREAKALGPVPAAAPLFHEIGLLHDQALDNQRQAALAYQQAFKLAPKFQANIRAARALFARVGNWAMVATLLDAELAASESRRTRAGLLLERAQVLGQRLNREADARAALSQCLALEPRDVSLLAQLELTFSQEQDFAALARVYQLFAAAMVDQSARAHYLTAAGLLMEDRVKDPARAAALYREAFALDRRDPQLLSAIKRTAQREGKVDEELTALAAEAEGLGAQAGPTFVQISRAYERLGRAPDALAALRAAQRTSPGDPLVLSELARLLEAQGHFEELAEVLGTWSERVADQNEFVALTLRLATVLEEQLKRDADALLCYRRVLQASPGHAAALAAMGKLCFRAQDWAGLVQTYEAEAAAAEDPRARAGRLYKAGETQEERLQDPDGAITRYQECLQLQPDFLPAQKALERLLERLARWPELIQRYEQELAQTTDREMQLTTLHRIAALYEDRLGDLPTAAATLGRALQVAPDHRPTLRNLARLYERGSRWGELIALVDHEARLTSDPKQLLSLAHRRAELIEDQLKDREGAITAWEAVLALAPTYQPALRSLGRLYGLTARWDALARMYRAEAELAATADQAAQLTFKIGELQEQKLGSIDEAISAWREVLTLAPSHPGALSALARVYRAQGAWESLVEVHYAEAASRANPSERAHALFQAASLWEEQLKNADQAILGYRDVLELDPSHTTALANLERLLTARDDVQGLVGLLSRESETATGAARLGARLRLARLALDRLGDQPRAVAACEAALELEPRNLSALRLLERAWAHDQEKRDGIRARIAEAWGDPRLAAAFRLASLEQGPAAESVLAELRAAFAADPGDELLGLALERALRQAGDARGLVEVYERRRQAVTEVADQLQLTVRLAELHEQALGDLPRARAEWEQAAALLPGFPPALQAMVRLARRQQDLPGALSALETLAAQSRDPATSLQARYDAALLARDEARDDERAVALARRVLEQDPSHAGANAVVEEVLARRGGPSDLASLHEKRAEALLAQQDAPGAARELLGSARLHLEALGQPERGTALLDRALSLAPALPDALDLKGELAWAAKDLQTAAVAWSHRVQHPGDPARLAQLHLRLGTLFQDTFRDLPRAGAHLLEVLRQDPASVEALERLAQLYLGARNWANAAEMYRRLLTLEQTPRGRSRYLLELARVFEDGLQDPAQALGAYRKALELNPGDQATLERLVHLCERTGNQAELVRLLEQQASQAGDGRKSMALRLRAASLVAKGLGDPQRAIQMYRQVLEMDASNIGAWTALAELYGRDTNTVALAVDAHRNILKYEPTRLESLHALYKLWKGIRQTDKAFCTAALLVFLRAATEEEQTEFSEARNRLPGEMRGVLSPQDLTALHHPGARSALVEVLRAIGDQLSKLYPPQFEAQGVDRKADRLKPDHAIAKAVHAVASVLGVEEYEVYQSRRGLLTLETTEPPALCVGVDLVRRFNVREQRFHLGRAVVGLLDKTAVLRRVSNPDAADLLGNAVRIHRPDYQGLGHRSDDQSKALRKACSRKALKALEEAAATQAALPQAPSMEGFQQALAFTADRAGLLACADPSTGLALVLREDSLAKHDSADAVQAAIGQRPELRELVTFAMSDDFFRLRQRVGLSLG